jgi:hypothetical protein
MHDAEPGALVDMNADEFAPALRAPHHRAHALTA